jgi:glycosyltransferase involved in cell wall biosynthesis
LNETLAYALSAIMRILFALPGLHKYDRGAEIAFISIALELAKAGESVTLIGSGVPRSGAPYRFLRAPVIARELFESFPSLPILRNEYAYEELTFVPGLLRRYQPSDYDVTLTCSYPLTNWTLRRPVLGGRRPPHVFVTQNGDWPAQATNSEYRFFGCEGLVCTNPDFYERNKAQWRCCLIPNGVDTARFQLGAPQRPEFGLPAGRIVVLMVSALISSKRVEAGVEAVSRIPNAHLVVAGDGPLRQPVDARAAALLPDRFTRLSVAPERMPQLYRSADVFLHLSKEESFGNVFVEAMACGLPVVGHDSSRLRWIVGDDGFLVDTEDLAAVAKQIELAALADPVKQARRIARATTLFSWSKIGELYRAFLRDLISSRAAGSLQKPLSR